MTLVSLLVQFGLDCRLCRCQLPLRLTFCLKFFHCLVRGLNVGLCFGKLSFAVCQLSLVRIDDFLGRTLLKYKSHLERLDFLFGLFQLILERKNLFGLLSVCLSQSLQAWVGQRLLASGRWEGCSELGGGLAEGRVVDFGGDVALFDVELGFDQRAQTVKFLLVQFIFNFDFIYVRGLERHFLSFVLTQFCLQLLFGQF